MPSKKTAKSMGGRLPVAFLVVVFSAVAFSLILKRTDTPVTSSAEIGSICRTGAEGGVGAKNKAFGS